MENNEKSLQFDDFFRFLKYFNFRDKIIVSYFWRENSNNVLFSIFFPPP